MSHGPITIAWPVYSRGILRPITVIRAVQWAAIVVTGWSLNMPWGDELAVGKGPPSQWERHIVGACLLLLIGAVALGRSVDKKGSPKRAPMIIAGLCGALALALAMAIRGTSLDNNQAHVLLGGGWMWMMAGCTMSAGAVSSALTLALIPDKQPAIAKTSDCSGKPKTNKPKRKKKRQN